MTTSSSLLRQAGELSILIEYASKKANSIVELIQDKTKRKVKKLQDMISRLASLDLGTNGPDEVAKVQSEIDSKARQMFT